MVMRWRRRTSYQLTLADGVVRANLRRSELGNLRREKRSRRAAYLGLEDERNVKIQEHDREHESAPPAEGVLESEASVWCTVQRTTSPACSACAMSRSETWLMIFGQFSTRLPLRLPRGAMAQPNGGMVWNADSQQYVPTFAPQAPEAGACTDSTQ